MVKVGGELKIFIIQIITITLISVSLSGCLNTNRHVTICDIQDYGNRSPLFMHAVSVTGVTSAILNDDIQGGLFIQDDHCERGKETKRSSGLFVLYDDEFERVSIGDEVTFTGIVIEYAQETLLIAENESLQVVSVSNPLPDVISLSLKPQEIDPYTYYESHEGMLVRIPSAQVIAEPGNGNNIWIIPGINPRLSRVDINTPGVLNIFYDQSGMRLSEISKGDFIENLMGILRQTGNSFYLYLTSPRQVVIKPNLDGSEVLSMALEFQPDEEALDLHGIQSTTQATETPQPSRTPTPYAINLLISEIHPNPKGKEPDGEWIEIYNPESYGLPLTGVKIGDETSPEGNEGMLMFPTGYYIEAREVLIIANRAATFRGIHGFFPDFEMGDSDDLVPDLLPYPNWGSGSIQFSNNGDEAVLLDPWDQIIDLVSYGNSTYRGFANPVPAPDEGHTIERYPAEKDRDHGNDWRERSNSSPGRLDRSPPTPQVTQTRSQVFTDTPSLEPSQTITETVTVTNTIQVSPSTTPTIDVIDTQTVSPTITPIPSPTEDPLPSNTPESTLSNTPEIIDTLTRTLEILTTASQTPIMTLPDITVTSTSFTETIIPKTTLAGSITPSVISTPTGTSTLATTHATITPTSSATKIFLEDDEIVLNEIHADPDPNLGDANRDGIVHRDDDEFLELINISDHSLDISGWVINDAIQNRYTFPPDSILNPGCGLIVFGGGHPTGDFGGAQIHLTGSLSLNNSGDVMSLFDEAGRLRLRLTYGDEGGLNQSLNRFPDLIGSIPLVLHSEIPDANSRLYSPGVRVDGTAFESCQ